MPDSEQREAFVAAHRQRLEQSLLTEEQLLALRERIGAAMGAVDFCDGCGFCCIEHVAMTRLEYERIERLVGADPSVFTLQGHVCPFLALDRQRFDDFVVLYGKKRGDRPELGCRIYAERPIICRTFPRPKAAKCREWDMLEAPPLTEVLSQPDFADFPESLIQRYYLTRNWDATEHPEDILDPALAFHLVPGWIVNRAAMTLELKQGPHWLEGLMPIPKGYPSVYECELEDWAADVFEALRSPLSYLDLLEAYGERVPASDLGALMAQAELGSMVVAVDFGARTRLGGLTFLDWRRSL